MSAIPFTAPAAQRARAVPDRCPECGGQLVERGPFDGSEAATGVSGGHEGFGETVLCPAGHWYAAIQGALVPPRHVLTVLETAGPALTGGLFAACCSSEASRSVTRSGATDAGCHVPRITS